MSTKNTSYIQVEGFNIRPNPELGEDLDDVLLNIIRVNSQKTGALSAFLARRKCYRICKKVTGRVDYKEYVQRLLLDNYPGEFKKAEWGKIIVVLLYLTIPVLVLGTILFVVGVVDLKYSWEVMVFGLILLALSFLGIWRVIQNAKKIRDVVSE